MSSPYNFPNIYACQHACQLEDMPLYRCLAQKYGQRLLELGCGTGRITIPLAREGFYVDGVDRDPMMLNWAREQLKNETPQVQSRIHLLEMDITSMATGRQ
ncbi:MAG: class I SAM-dependent methyltransferase, partial [Spirochaetaceae bacterium]